MKSARGFVVPRGDQKHNLSIVDFHLLEPDTPNTSEIEERAAGTSNSNSQTPTPGREASGSSSMTKQQHRTRQPRASVLAAGSDAIYALTAPTLIQQVEMLLEGHKLGEATNLAQEHQRKLEQKKRTSHSYSASDIEAQVSASLIRTLNVERSLTVYL